MGRLYYGANPSSGVNAADGQHEPPIKPSAGVGAATRGAGVDAAWTAGERLSVAAGRTRPDERGAGGDRHARSINDGERGCAARRAAVGAHDRAVERLSVAARRADTRVRRVDVGRAGSAAARLGRRAAAHGPALPHGVVGRAAARFKVEGVGDFVTHRVFNFRRPAGQGVGQAECDRLAPKRTPSQPDAGAVEPKRPPVILQRLAQPGLAEVAHQRFGAGAYVVEGRGHEETKYG